MSSCMGLIGRNKRENRCVQYAMYLDYDCYYAILFCEPSIYANANVESLVSLPSPLSDASSFVLTLTPASKTLIAQAF